MGQLAEQMMDLARLRNLLVHVYWQIDHRKVYDDLPARLTTLEAFTKRMVRWLKEQA